MEEWLGGINPTLVQYADVLHQHGLTCPADFGMMVKDDLGGIADALHEAGVPTLQRTFIVREIGKCIPAVPDRGSPIPGLPEPML